MKTLIIDGITYACPFADEYDAHAPDELATLTESIKARGVLDTVHVYTSVDHGPAILDGVTRARLGIEHDHTVPTFDLGEMNEEEALKILEEKHHGRRNLSPEAMKRRREKRIARIAAKRMEGESLQSIAEREQVSKAQVRRDIKDSKAGVPGGTPEPEKVKGKDGKIYAPKPKQPTAKKPAPASHPEPPAPTPLSGRTDPSANASDVQAGTEEHDEVDGEGEEAAPREEPTPEADAGEVFLQDVETLCRDMDKIAARIKAMKATPYAFSIHLDSAASQVEAARKTLWQGRPAHPCPYCRANEQVKPDCRACHGTSRVKKSVYDAGVDAVGGGH